MGKAGRFKLNGLLFLFKTTIIYPKTGFANIHI